MKEIQLSPSKTGEIKTAVVDDADYAMLMQFKWYYHRHGYAVTTQGTDKIAMHRLVLGAHLLRGARVSAIDGNFLNCQKNNLTMKQDITAKYLPKGY
jgi:hypothetical protein